MKFTLQQKILLIATAVILIVITSVVGTNAYFTSKEYQNALESRALAIGKSLAIQLERLLQFGLEVRDISGFEDQCQEIVETYSGIQVAMVVNQRGNILFRSRGEVIPVEGRVKRAVSSGVERVVTLKSVGVTWHAAVIPAKDLHGDNVAAVIVGFPEQLISAKLSGIFWLELGVGALVLLAGLTVLFIALARYVTRPLTDLIESVVLLRQSPIETGLRTPANTEDEPGQLGRAFNELLDELQRTTVSKSMLENAIEEMQRLSSVLYEQKERLEVTLRSLADAVISVNKNATVHFLNPPAEKLCGWSWREAEGQPLQNVLNLFDAGTKEPLPNPFEPAFFQGQTVSNRVDAELLRRDGTAVAVDYTASPMHGLEGNLTGGVLILRDVTNERQMARRLAWEASHDSLTGLCNRQEFIDRLQSLLTKTQDQTEQHIVLFLDLDRFRAINDMAGHAAGDDLLRLVARTLSDSVRPTDTVARLGGDEFALLLESCTLSQGEVIAEKILTRIEKVQYQHDSTTHHISVSIGIARVDADATCKDVFSIADFACRTAKCRGRSYAYASSSEQHLKMGSKPNAAVLGRLNLALAEDSFTLFFQRVVPVNGTTDDTDHFEVLLRLPQENGEPHLPSTFLPTAVRFGLMAAIDKWVLRKILTNYHKLLRQKGCETMICSINLSRESLTGSEITEFIRVQAEVHAIPSGAICFELDEAVALEHPEALNRFGQFCHSRGFLLALDNMKAGSDTLDKLDVSLLSFIKVDCGELTGLSEATGTAHGPARIMQISQLSQLRIIAKTVEHSADLERLASLGVALAQGFGIHTPQPLFT